MVIKVISRVSQFMINRQPRWYIFATLGIDPLSSVIFNKDACIQSPSIRSSKSTFQRVIIRDIFLLIYRGYYYNICIIHVTIFQGG